MRLKNMSYLCQTAADNISGVLKIVANNILLVLVLKIMKYFQIMSPKSNGRKGTEMLYLVRLLFLLHYSLSFERQIIQLSILRY